MNLESALDTLKQQLIEALDAYRIAVSYQDQQAMWFYRGQVDALETAMDVLEAAMGDSK